MIDSSSDNPAEHAKFQVRLSRSKTIPTMVQNFRADRCLPSVVMRVDQACATTNFSLTGKERRKLVTALISRQHLVLTGPPGIGKCLLASELALSLTQKQSNYFRLIQGHPWWATQTGDVSRYVSLQMEFSILRLLDFVEVAQEAQELSIRTETSQGPVYVACIERMSPVELDFYFGVFARWLSKRVQNKAQRAPLQLTGTYDSQQPPVLDQRILAQTAVVHLGRSVAG